MEFATIFKNNEKWIAEKLATNPDYFIAIAKWFCKKRKKTGKKTDFGDNVSGKI